jgi:hypothetical protein
MRSSAAAAEMRVKARHEGVDLGELMPVLCHHGSYPRYEASLSAKNRIPCIKSGLYSQRESYPI